METKKTLNSQNNLEEEQLEQSHSLTSDYTKIYSHENSMVLTQKQKYRSMEQNRKPRKPHTYSQLIYNKEGKDI